MFEFIRTNSTESCTPSARCSQMQPVELLLAHVLVKPIYLQATCALNDSGKAGGGRSEHVKSRNSGFGKKLKKPLQQMKVPDIVGKTSYSFKFSSAIQSNCRVINPIF